MRRGGLLLILAALGVAGEGGDGGPRGISPAPPGTDSARRLEAPLMGASRGEAPQEVDEGPPYNGRFTFIRLRFGDSGSDLRNFGFGGRGRRGGRG
ncbi:MAG: hypothetical protein PVJ04_02230, partial [Gemmatimonadota bacterium]